VRGWEPATRKHSNYPSEYLTINPAKRLADKTKNCLTNPAKRFAKKTEKDT
jgi:hypothetical protein